MTTFPRSSKLSMVGAASRSAQLHGKSGGASPFLNAAACSRAYSALRLVSGTAGT
eukprot:CAMPEP_0172912386 /NCGR_PEP_ID=MMETSP1075-20121228/188302_1 /TAXON_ID=2916 /ORGANISM="Ceratium fusus, Strain PA161109" /LENGTH=54 /DNA_ID=CAMNT_0013770867 /DNA_START=345 /DNA_END=506 /DNA_ORIENTATION=+